MMGQYTDGTSATGYAFVMYESDVWASRATVNRFDRASLGAWIKLAGMGIG